MKKTSKMTVAALATVLSLGGLTAFAMGVSKTAAGDSASSLSGDTAKAKVIKIKRVKKVQADMPAGAAASGYGSSSFVSSGSSPSVQAPTQGAATVRPPRETDEGGWDDDGGEEYEDHDEAEGDDD